MTAETRTYRMKRRAASQEETRQRIAESAMELHSTLGPSRTSISAVATRAGVRRSTVYRHFPDEAALFDACTAHWSAANPFPDLAGWLQIADPDERLRVALPELYGFYGRNSRLLGNLLRDESSMPLIEERFAVFHDYAAAARDALMAGRRLRGAARHRAQGALGHAVAFTTWRSLTQEQSVADADAVALMCALVAAATGGEVRTAVPAGRRRRHTAPHTMALGPETSG